MKPKLPAMILLMLGFVSFVFGARAIATQYVFAKNADIVQGEIISVGTSGKQNTTKVVVSYKNDGVTTTDQLHLPMLSNTLEFSEGSRVTLRISHDPTQNPEAYRSGQDAVMYYGAGVFFILFGLVFALFGLLIQKFRPIPYESRH